MTIEREDQSSNPPATVSKLSFTQLCMSFGRDTKTSWSPEDPTQGGICNLSWSHRVVVSISNPKRLELFPDRPPEKRRAGSVYNSNDVANSLYERLERNKSAYNLHKCCVCACYINLFSICTFGLLIIINM